MAIYQDPATSPQRSRWPLAADGWSSAPDPLARAAQPPPPPVSDIALTTVSILLANRPSRVGTTERTGSQQRRLHCRAERTRRYPKLRRRSRRRQQSNSRRVIRPPTSGSYICNAQTQVVQIRMRALPGLTNSKWSSNLASALVCLHPLAAAAAQLPSQCRREIAPCARR